VGSIEHVNLLCTANKHYPVTVACVVGQARQAETVSIVTLQIFLIICTTMRWNDMKWYENREAMMLL
jgi:hypothetical protein